MADRGFDLLVEIAKANAVALDQVLDVLDEPLRERIPLDLYRLLPPSPGAT